MTNHQPVSANSNHSNALTERTTLYDFYKQGKGNWRTQNDVVMGGRSDSQVEITTDGHARFSGRVSLENNGGFCSMRHIKEGGGYAMSKDATAFVLLVQGDGKDYNFRLRTLNERFSYNYKFTTQDNDKWETIAIPFDAMQATFRGRSVNVPNYAGEDFVEMRILIGNKKEQTFEILVSKIEVI